MVDLRLLDARVREQNAVLRSQAIGLHDLVVGTLRFRFQHAGQYRAPYANQRGLRHAFRAVAGGNMGDLVSNDGSKSGIILGFSGHLEELKVPVCGRDAPPVLKHVCA